MRNLASWTFVCPRRNLVHPAPGNNGSIDLRYSADPLKAVSSLRLVPYPRAILKIRQPSSLVYRPRHGVLPNGSYEPGKISGLIKQNFFQVQTEPGMENPRFLVQFKLAHLNNYFSLHVCPSFRASVSASVRRLAPIPAGELQNVTNKSCYICLRDDKNALRVIS